MHYKVQQAMLDSLEQQAFTLTPEELGEIWDADREACGDGEDRRSSWPRRRAGTASSLSTGICSPTSSKTRRSTTACLGQLEDFKRSIYPYA